MKTEKQCKLCGKMHPLEYQIQKNNTKHLVYRCPFRKQKFVNKAVEFLPMREGLPISSFFSDNARHQMPVEGQEILF